MSQWMGGWVGKKIDMYTFEKYALKNMYTFEKHAVQTYTFEKYTFPVMSQLRGRRVGKNLTRTPLKNML